MDSTHSCQLSECCCGQGGIDAFSNARGGRLDKRRRDFDKQQKLLRQCKEKGLTARKAERDVLAQMQLAVLIEKPREYKVCFEFQSRDDDFAAIGALDAGFGYDGGAPIFERLNFGVHGESRVAVVGRSKATPSRFDACGRRLANPERRYRQTAAASPRCFGC